MGFSVEIETKVLINYKESLTKTKNLCVRRDGFLYNESFFWGKRDFTPVNYINTQMPISTMECD